MATASPTPFTAFTRTGPFGGAAAAPKLVDLAVTPPNHRGSRTDDVELQIDQTGLSPAAGESTGTLTGPCRGLEAHREVGSEPEGDSVEV